MEIFEALEKYTVIQLIFAFLVLLPVWGIVKEVRLFRTGGKNESPDAIDTAKIIAETLGGIIANELDKVTSSVRDDQQTNTKEHHGIIDALNNHGKIMNRSNEILDGVVNIITEHNDKSETFHDTIGTLVGQLNDNLGETNKVVEVMETDIDKIKTDLGAMKATVEDINRKVGGLSSEIQVTMRQLTAAVEKLEIQLSKETPATPKPKTETKEEITNE